MHCMRRISCTIALYVFDQTVWLFNVEDGLVSFQATVCKIHQKCRQIQKINLTTNLYEMLIL